MSDQADDSGRDLPSFRPLFQRTARCLADGAIRRGPNAPSFGGGIPTLEREGPAGAECTMKIGERPLPVPIGYVLRDIAGHHGVVGADVREVATITQYPRHAVSARPALGVVEHRR